MDNMNSDLKRLQNLRTKANTERKPAYQKKVDNYFFDNSGFNPRETEIPEVSWDRRKN
jgi:hypothetical protein